MVECTTPVVKTAGQDNMAIYGNFIGIDRFADSTVRELTGCRRDALALWSLFSDTIPDFTGTLLLDEKATVDAIRMALVDVLSTANSSDTVIISFSSHGTHDHRLVAHDTDVTDLPTTTIDMAELGAAFRTTKAKAVVCILDCCFSGGAPARVLENSPTTRTIDTPLASIAGAGRILIAASGVNEPALEHARHGLFTFALIEALQSDSPIVSIPIIMDQVMHRVRAEAQRRGHNQNPVLFGYVDGGLVIPSLRRGARFHQAFPEASGIRVSSTISDLSAFALPASILTAWQDLFPNGLNELQIAAINDHGLLEGNSLFVIAPTSSGKTFLGELAAAKAVSERRKAVYLFPYRALVNEKFDYFSELYGRSLGLRVIRCTGDYLDQTSDFLRGQFDIALLTYEMYLSISVTNPATLDSLGLLVLDEAQFITNPLRGIVVELLLTNVLAARDRGVTPQIVALSAVVGSENSFHEWLGASLLMTTKRPVPLIEGVLDRAGVFQFIDENGVQHTAQLLPRHAIVQRRDKPSSQDVIVPLVKQLLGSNSDERIIIFRNSRGTAEGCALYVAADLRLPPATDVLGALPEQDRSTTSESLRECLQGGTAFHTSNLTREERISIERGFRQRNGPIKVLGATTTVAAGINTPASTVILAEQEFYGEENQPFTVAEYKNMAGRAGRVGYHEVGRSIILADTPVERQQLFRRYVTAAPEPISSSFRESDVATWLLRLLSQVKVITRDDAVKLLASTYGGYLASKADPDWHDRTVGTLTTLLAEMLDLRLVEEELGGTRLTLLGRACGNSSLNFRSALRLVQILRGSVGTSLTAEKTNGNCAGTARTRSDLHAVNEKGNFRKSLAARSRLHIWIRNCAGSPRPSRRSAAVLRPM
jgi:helicase